MSWLRIKTVVRRHWYVLWRSPNRWFDIAVWPVFDPRLPKDLWKGGLAISGLYDLEPVRLCYVNDKLGLDETGARRLSPLLNIPRQSNPLLVAYGTGELPELQRQSQEFATAWTRRGLPGRLAALEGHNHFTILEELARPEGALTALVKDLVT